MFRSRVTPPSGRTAQGSHRGGGGPRDIDLAVIAGPDWDGRTDLEDAVRSRVGNGCDVLVFTASQFEQLARSGEPVVADILREGVALIGSMPGIRVGVA